MDQRFEHFARSASRSSSSAGRFFRRQLKDMAESNDETMGELRDQARGKLGKLGTWCCAPCEIGLPVRDAAEAWQEA